jgi:hypothetical protein
VDERAKIDIRLRQFLEHHGLVRKRSSPAVFFGQVRQQDACRASLGPGFGIGAVLQAPASVLRRKFFLHELANGLAKHPQIVIHPGRFGVHNKYCKATGGVGSESLKQDVLEKLWYLID